MRLIMVDDSEEKQPSRGSIGHLVGVGAAVFPEDKLAHYTNGIRALREELSIPPGTELKWSPDNGSWLKSDEGNKIRTRLRRDMINLADEAGVRTVTVIWDRGRVPWSLEDTRREVLKYLYDKLSLFLRIDANSLGIVIADEPGGGQAAHKAWLADTLRLTDLGTTWTKPEQIVLPIVTAPSHHVPHLQLSDLIAGATVAAVAGNKYALELVPDLQKIAHRNSKGCIGGAGVTLWPPELGNLHHHIFGDDESWRGNVGISLPYKGWDFVDGDGLSNASQAPPSEKAS